MLALSKSQELGHSSVKTTEKYAKLLDDVGSPSATAHQAAYLAKKTLGEGRHDGDVAATDADTTAAPRRAK